MSLNSINRFLTNNTLWVFFSFIVLSIYLSPLLMNGGVFYTPIFDNLDSNVVWFKILAESGMIFSDNSAIIPNMMNGLPRSSYSSEFSVILWLYYFFEPKTAYIINEIAIHVVAFFSMFIFLKRYVVKENKYYANVPTYVGALYFSLIPYWSGAGLTIAIIPLVTYSLLNIKNNQFSKWDWILLIVLPLYTSFIFFYIFYIIMAGIYMIYDTFKNHQFNKLFFFAIFLMGTMFLLSQYRLIYSMFIDSGFISHRTEFDIFFNKNLFESYRLSLDNFLIGHVPHAQTLQQTFLLPIVLITLLLSLVKRKFNQRESLIIWILVILSFIINLWDIILVHKYTLPGISILTIYVFFFHKKSKNISFYLLLIIFLSIFAAAFQYNGLKWISAVFPLLKGLNLIRMLFIQPFILVILLTLSSILIIRKLHYPFIFILLFMIFQSYTSYTESFYQSNPKEEYASFEDYYALKPFIKLKDELLSDNIDQAKFVNYGIEPAVALFNGLHTIDGYSTNYPLSYKHQFKKVFSQYHSDDLFDTWGSKVYILTIANQFEKYHKDLKIEVLRFDTEELCQLNATHMLSPYLFKSPENKSLVLMNTFKGSNTSWDIYVYKLQCK